MACGVGLQKLPCIMGVVKYVFRVQGCIQKYFWGGRGGGDFSIFPIVEHSCLLGSLDDLVRSRENLEIELYSLLSGWGYAQAGGGGELRLGRGGRNPGAPLSPLCIQPWCGIMVYHQFIMGCGQAIRV